MFRSVFFFCLKLWQGAVILMPFPVPFFDLDLTCLWYFAKWGRVHDLLNSAAITEMLCHARSSRSRGFCRNIDPFPACTLNIRSTSVCRSIVYLEMTPSSESILLSEEHRCCGAAYWTKNNAAYKVTSRFAAKEHGNRVTARRSRTDYIQWAWRPLEARTHLFSVQQKLVILLFQTQSFREAAPFANYPPDVRLPHHRAPDVW